MIKDNTAPIVLRTRHIRIENDGELHIGSENCPFRSSLTIILYGRYVIKPTSSIILKISPTRLFFFVVVGWMDGGAEI